MSRKAFARWSHFSLPFFAGSPTAGIRLFRFLAGLACLLAAILLLSPDASESRAQGGKVKGGLDQGPFRKQVPRDPKADKERAEWEEASKKLEDQVRVLDLQRVTNYIASGRSGFAGILSVPAAQRQTMKWTSPTKYEGYVSVCLGTNRCNEGIWFGDPKQDSIYSRAYYFNGTKGDATMTFDLWNAKTNKWDNLWTGKVPSRYLGVESYTGWIPRTYKFRDHLDNWNYKFRWHMTAGKVFSDSTTTVSLGEARPPVAQ